METGKGKEKEREKTDQKRPQIKSVVIRTITLGMVTRRQNRHLMPIDAVIIVKMADFLRNLPRRERVAPCVQQFRKHAPRPQPLDLAQAAEDGEFGVRDAHVRLVALDVVCGDGFEFRGRHGVEEGGEDGEGEGGRRPVDEGFEVGFGDCANGVEVRGAAVVFCEVAPQGLVDVGGTED